MKQHYITICCSLTMIVFSCNKKTGDTAATAISSNGDITASVDQFRALLGGPVNSSPGATGGRREINWESIPDSLIGKPLPPDFFNPLGAGAPASRQRGLRYSSSGIFMVSDNNFAAVNPEASARLKSFSGQRSFANISASLWEVLPDKPGSAERASVHGFGIVFSGVDLQNSTSMEFFENEESLGKYFVPVHDGHSAFSFLGVYFHDRKITRIQVSHLGALSDPGSDVSNGGNRDFISMDDFLYDEPN